MLDPHDLALLDPLAEIHAPPVVHKIDIVVTCAERPRSPQGTDGSTRDAVRQGRFLITRIVKGEKDEMCNGDQRAAVIAPIELRLYKD